VTFAVGTKVPDGTVRLSEVGGLFFFVSLIACSILLTSIDFELRDNSLVKLS